MLLHHTFLSHSIVSWQQPTHCVSSSASFLLPSSPKFWAITCLFMFSMVYGSHGLATFVMLPLLLLLALIVDPHNLAAQTQHRVVLAGGNDMIYVCWSETRPVRTLMMFIRMLISCCSKQTVYPALVYDSSPEYSGELLRLERCMCRGPFIALITSFRGSFLHAARVRNMWRGSRRWFVCVRCTQKAL